MKYFSTFSGIGGFELGIEKARGGGLEAECIGYSDVDKYAIQIYEKHFEHKNYGDITKIKAENLPDFDLLCGGFPCQAFSIAGKRRGFEDTRGTLFFDVARILDYKRPRLVLLENVKGLLSHENGRTFKTIISTLAELGYSVEWQVLNSKNFGVPQNRERVFIAGYLGKFPGRKIFPITENDSEDIILPTITTRITADSNGSYVRKKQAPKQIIGGSQGNRVYDPSGISTTIASQAGGLGAKTGLYAIPVLTPNRINKRQNGRRFKENGEPSFTLTGQDVHGVMVPEATKKGYAIAHEGDSINLSVPNSKTRRGRVGQGIAQTIDTGMQQHTLQGCRIRRLTPRECERLQGFPDDWTAGASDTQRYKMCGNAVTVNVVEVVVKKMMINYKQWKI